MGRFLHAFAAAGLCCGVLIASPASASLIGDFIDIDMTFHDQATFPNSDGYTAEFAPLSNVEVTGGQEAAASYSSNTVFPVEGEGSGGTIIVDVDAEQFGVFFLLVGSNNPGIAPAFIPGFTLRLGGLEWVGMTGEITDVVANPINMLGDLTEIRFGADGSPGASYIEFVFDGFKLPSDVAFLPLFPLELFTITTRHGEIPEPASWALVGFGLAGVGMLRRRKRG